MYGKDERDLAVTLTRMADLARERSNFNHACQSEATRPAGGVHPLDQTCGIVGIETQQKSKRN